MPTSLEHFDYTVNEWSKYPFTIILDGLKDIKVAYDVGANVGGFAEILTRRFPDAEIHCFEPVRDNYTLLQENVPFAKAHNIAIFYGPKEAKLMWRGSNDGAVFLDTVEAGEPMIDRGEIATIKTFEQLKLPKPDLIKLDVEGAEVNIVENSRMLKNTPYVIIEWHPDQKPDFEKHLPDHFVKENIEGKQYLLCLKSLS